MAKKRRDVNQKPSGSASATDEPNDSERSEASGAKGEVTFKTVGEVCQFLGITAPTFDKYLASGCPGKRGSRGKSNGRFPLGEIVQWLRQNVWQPKPQQSRADLENEKLAADIRIANLKADKLEETLVDRSAVEAVLKSILNVVRGRLDQVPIELSNTLPAKMRSEFKRDAQNKIDLIKMELAEIGHRGGLEQ